MTMYILCSAGPSSGAGISGLSSIALKWMFWTSTANVLCFLILLQLLRMMPPFSLVYISDSVNPFLLFWVLLKWFVLCSFLYFHIFIFSRITSTFRSLKFLFFLYIIIQSLYFLLPLELIYFMDCWLYSSLPGIPLFLLFSPELCQVFPWSHASFFVLLLCFDGAHLQVLPERGFGEINYSSPWMPWALSSILTRGWLLNLI